MIALILDTETTGLIDNHTLPLEKQPEVIEFYGCLADLSSGEVMDEFDTLIKPVHLPLSVDIQRITKLTDEDLEFAPVFSEISERLTQLIEPAPAVIAHNLSFDQEMVDLEFERLGKILVWPKSLICTVEQTVHLKGMRLTLTKLHEHLFDEPFKDAHRARHDVQALLRCAIELHKTGDL